MPGAGPGRVAVAQSPILVTTITLKRLVKRGYEALLDYYRKVSPQITNRCMQDPLVQWYESLTVGDFAHGRLLDWV